MSDIKERYVPKPIGVNGNVVCGRFIAGFLAVTSGTLTVTDGYGTVLINAVPVTAGVYTPMPFVTGDTRTVVQLAGGASGTLGV